MPHDDYEAGRLHITGLQPTDIALLKNIAVEAAEAATQRWFILMGLDPKDPISSQANFTLLREMQTKIKDPEFIADLDWAHRTRLTTDGVLGKLIMTAISVSVAGALWTFWIGLKGLMGRND